MLQLQFTCATPVTEMGTPWLVYTRFEMMTNVMEPRGILWTFWMHGNTMALPPTISSGVLPQQTPLMTRASFGPQVTTPMSKHITNFAIQRVTTTNEKTENTTVMHERQTRHTLFFSSSSSSAKNGVLSSKTIKRMRKKHIYTNESSRVFMLA